MKTACVVCLCSQDPVKPACAILPEYKDRYKDKLQLLNIITILPYFIKSQIFKDVFVILSKEMYSIPGAMWT